MSQFNTRQLGRNPSHIIIKRKHIKFSLPKGIIVALATGTAFLWWNYTIARALDDIKIPDMPEISPECVLTHEEPIRAITYHNDIRERVYALTDGAGMKRANVDAVIGCESGWNPNAYNPNSKDYGLWQINKAAHILPGSISEECAYDVECSTNYAILLWQKHSWHPWICSQIVGIA